MIDLNVIVPVDENLRSDECGDLFIITESFTGLKEFKFYVVRTTEEKFTFLSLKYGQRNVWKR